MNFSLSFSYKEGSNCTPRIRPRMLSGPVSMGSVAADIYLFTPGSLFNQIQFTDYVIEGMPIAPFLGQFGSLGNASSVDDLNNGSGWIAQQTATGWSTLHTRTVSPSSSGRSVSESSSTVSANAKTTNLNSCEGKDSLSGNCGSLE